MATQAQSVKTYSPSGSFLNYQTRKFLVPATLTLFASLIIGVFLLPIIYATVVAFRNDKAFQESPNAPWWPAKAANFIYNGKEVPIYKVPFPDGSIRNLALVDKGRQESGFVDPANPKEIIRWQGVWRTLDRDWQFSPYTGNFTEVFKRDDVSFTRSFSNSLFIAAISLVLDLISCVLVAYGYSRFRFPGKDILFYILIATIILPTQVTVIARFAMFNTIGWFGTWLPLIVPSLFANAFDVFLLRQFFLGIPKELDEAAMIDGASPLRILTSVILPNSWPVVTAVAIFHFLFKWNDFFEPLIYLSGVEPLQTLPLAMAKLQNTFGSSPSLLMATIVLAVALPMIIFLVGNRQFMRGVVVTGIEK